MVTEEITPKSATTKLNAPWTAVVRRGDNEPQNTPPALSPSHPETPGMDLGTETQPDGNAGGLIKLAWNNPLVNGVVDGGPVIGDVVSWPALSESTRTGSKVAFESVISSSQVTSNANSQTNFAANNTGLARPKGKSRGGGRGGSHPSRTGSSQNNFNRHTGPMPPPFPVIEIPYSMTPPPMQDPTIGAQRPVGGIGGFRPRTGSDQSSSPRNNSRGGHYGSRPRGDRQHGNNNGGRQDQALPTQHYVVPPPMGGYVPPPLPHGVGPFVASPQIRMLSGPMRFDMVPPMFGVPPMHPDVYRAMPLISGIPHMPYPPPENPITNMIVKQIDYYFSDENLDKDEFLKSQMDEHGLVPVTLVASFRRVQLLTKDISEVFKALRYSIVVEIQGDKLRRRDDWHRWLRSSDSHNDNSGSRTSKKVLEVSLQRVSLNDSVTNANDNNTEISQRHTDTTTDNE